MSEDKYRAALDMAVKQLSYRALSAKMLRDKLLAKGHDEEAADYALAWLIERSMLNDELFAESVVRGYTRKGYGAASLVQFVEMFLKKAVPPLYASLGIFLPLITTNCCVLGVTLLVQREQYDLVSSLLYAFATGAGFLLALLLMAGVRERLETCRVPSALAGTPIALIMAGIMSLSFMAFKGMV